MPTLSQCQRVYDNLEPNWESCFVIDENGNQHKVKDVSDFSVTLIDLRGGKIIVSRSDYHKKYEEL